MSRYNVWVHFVEDSDPTLQTYFVRPNAKQLAEAYMAQMLSGQAMHGSKFIERIWIEEVTA